MGVLDPEHAASGGADGGGETVHLGNDIARRRADGVADGVVHEGVLQIDHHQGSLTGVEVGVRMLDPIAAQHALGHRRWNVQSVHRSISIIAAQCGCNFRAMEAGRRCDGIAEGAPIRDHVFAGMRRTGGSPTVANFFVSYTSSDRDWAHWIAAELLAQGHVPHVHEWEIEAGGNVLGWMEQHHDAADHVLCVVSAEYLKAPYSTLERQAAIWRAAKERSDFVLFVVVKPCALPSLIEHFRRCELIGLPMDAASQRFREFMTARAAPPTVSFPGDSVVAHSNISINVPRFFMGRDDAMVEIEATLSSGGGRAAITTLRGMRGVGKTVLAAAYADKHRFDYRATWWIRAETVDTIRADLSALAWRLGWASPDAPQDEVLRITAERLRAEGEGILLIIDNALDRDSIAGFLPRGGAAHVLITSNAHAWKGGAEEVEIRLWPRDIGAEFLLRRTGRSDERDAALALSDALGGLPLALEMGAAYCEELGLSLSLIHI